MIEIVDTTSLMCYISIKQIIWRIKMSKELLTVDEISINMRKAFDDFSAKFITENNLKQIIKEIVSVKEQRLKILDGDEAKAKFASKMGKGRLAKFYPLLKEVEEG